MRKIVARVAGLGAAALLAGCAMDPHGPTVSAFPPPYKPFEVFQQDEYMCEDYAHSQVAGDAQAANNRAVGAAAVGTALGLALGAATGDGHAAAFGAAGGAAVGGSIGANQSDRANFSLQRRYDNAYAQCMYAKGHRVPVSGQIQYTPSTPYSSAPSAPSAPSMPPPPPGRPQQALPPGIPPPPPGIPPPPPPR